MSTTSPEPTSDTSIVSKLETDEEIEDDSNTDYSDTESVAGRAIQGYIENRARSLVDHLMKDLRFEFDCESAIIRCTANRKDGSSSSTSQPPNSSAGLATMQRTACKNTIRRRRENEEDNSEGESEQIPAKRQKGKTKMESLPLACPFFKRKARLCTRYRSCSEKGWIELPRLKEHIERCHRIYQCPRCYSAFLQKEMLNAHIRSPTRCSERDKIPVFGVNEETFPLVHARLKRVGTPEEKWRELYHRIFPEIPLESIPCPYFDGRTPETTDDGYHVDITDGEEFYKQLQNDLPYRTLVLLRQVYQRDLAIAGHKGSESLRALMNTADFEAKLKYCMKCALEELRSRFLWAHLNAKPSSIPDDVCLSRLSDNLLQVDHQAAFGNFPSGETEFNPSVNISNTVPSINDWEPETDLGPNFSIEEAYQNWNWDSVDCPVPDLTFNNEFEGFECLSAQSVINTVTDNLTLNFPGSCNPTTTSMPQLHWAVPTLTKRDLGFSSDEIAAANELDKQFPSEMNTGHEPGLLFNSD